LPFSDVVCRRFTKLNSERADAGATQATVIFQFLPLFEIDAGQTVIGQFLMTCTPLATQATVFTKSQPKNSFLVRRTGKKVASNLKDKNR
jgi:hypothetical protein